MFSQLLTFQPSILLGELNPAIPDFSWSQAPPLLFSGYGVCAETAAGCLKQKGQNQVEWPSWGASQALLGGNLEQLWVRRSQEGLLVSVRTLCPEQEGGKLRVALGQQPKGVWRYPPRTRAETTLQSLVALLGLAFST